MTRGEARSRTLDGRWRVVVAVVGTCLLVCIVGWAALIGPSQVLAGPGPQIDAVTPTPAPEPTDDEDPTVTPEDLQVEDTGGGSSAVGGVVAVVAQAIALGLVALLVLVLLGRAVRARRRRRPDDPVPDVDFAVVEDPQRVRRAIADDAREQQQVLAQGEPRNAIVECWHRFELQAAAAGMPRREWETSSELALRLFERAEVDAGAVSRLMALYREARFSEHELVEADRAAAAAALAEIQQLVGSRQVGVR